VVRLLNGHPTLDFLADPEGAWTVEGVYLDDEEILFGYGEPADRSNNYENYCIVPFVVTVIE